MRLGLDLRLPYYTGGGIARYLQHLARWLPALAPQHTHLHVYRRGHRDNYSAQARRLACWTPPHHRFERYALSAELLPHRLDLWHAPDFIPPAFGYRRVVSTIHDLTFVRYPQFLTPDSRRYYNDQIRWAVAHAHALAADSFATRDDLVNLLDVPPDRISVIHLGLDTETFGVLPDHVVNSTLGRLGLSRGYVLFVGTFEPRKNVPGLLQAYARLRAHAPDAPPLVLVGRPGWLFDEAMQTLRDLRLEAHVRQLPDLPAADLPAVYNGAGVFVLPSHYEGFGFPVLEAFACGVPTVIADRASLPELAGDAALRVTPDDAEAIASALARALSDTTLRADLRAKGFARLPHFRWENTAKATLALYEKVLS
jgi:glycosyltransferase involved in cell wall biosynthesis